MCGIIGYIGNNSFEPQARTALNSLEYRGYDSAGVSYIYNNKLIVEKKVGNVNNLFDNITIPDEVHSGIGHTRWATHGAVSAINAHPHISFDKKFSLVHNGIIENYSSIKNNILSEIKFRTDVDTEVIVNLIAYYYQTNKNMLDVIFQTIKTLDGAYAFSVICIDEPSVIYYAKNASPMLIGTSDTEKFLASDLVGLSSNCKQYALIPDLSFGSITIDKVDCYDFNQNPIILDYKEITNSAKTPQKGNYDYFMQKEIEEIPSVITRTLQFYLNKDNPFTSTSDSFWVGIDKVEFIACGTSFHASKIGSALIEDHALIVSRAHVASEFVYNPPILNERTMCIFVSQSGETADTLHALKLVKSKGAKAVSITNVITSSIALLSDVVLPLSAGAEVAVASTKAYNAQVAVMYLLSEFLKKRSFDTTAKDIIDIVLTLNMKKMWENAKYIATKISDSKSIYFVGRHMDYITCLESSLKLKEITYIPCEAYPAGELKHGTIALIEKGTMMIAILTEPKLLNKTANIIAQAKARGAEIIYASNLTSKEWTIDANKLLELPQ
ncbi:MAG: glutamine--fructose-6-phosphate transaminase (isomerizing), partial [Clostridia bacterium]